MTNPDTDLVQEVSGLLARDQESWSAKARPGKFDLEDRDRVLDRMYAIRSALLSVNGETDGLAADRALARSEDFIISSFADYNGQPSKNYNSIFAVPTRPGDGSEVNDFVPILSQEFGVDADTRQYVVDSLAPSIIEEYKGDGVSNGAILYVPLNWTTLNKAEQLRWNRTNIDAAANFSRQKLRARVMGLGAILPLFSSFGRSISEEGLTTTTGHGGTVYLVVETLRDVINKKSELSETVKTIGVIGAAGSIGSSSVETILQDFDGYAVNMSDTNELKLDNLASQANWSDRTHAFRSNIEVLTSSDVIISAVTTKIDLDVVDPDLALDLGGKTIIDDSQPGCFNREQVEARGGKLVWVVGQDTSLEHKLQRVGNYTYGQAAGLYQAQGDENSAVWGCEAEAGVIGMSDRLDLAIRGQVDHAHVVALGGLLRAFDIRVASPLQSSGRPVDLAS